MWPFIARWPIVVVVFNPINSGKLGEVVHAEEGGSILIFDRDVVGYELIRRPIATRLDPANEFSHAQ